MAGTARPSMLGSFEWAEEASFAEDSATVDTRMQIRDARIDVSGLQRPLVPRGGVRQRMNEGDADIPGSFGVGTFTTTFDLYGHGSTTAGALTKTNLCLLLGHVFGYSDSTQVGGALTAGTNDANTLTSTNTTLLTGGLLRVGTLGDARGGGQLSVAADATSSYELLIDLPAAPNEADNVYAMQLVYPATVHGDTIITSSGATNNNTIRAVLQTGNLQFVCHGCVAQSVTLNNLSPGGDGLPSISITWATVHWDPISATFPDTTATDDKAPAPVTNGSLFINAKGTSTRVTDTCRNFSLNIGHAVQAITGPGGVHEGQSVIGWRRLPAQTTLSFDLEAQAATATPTYYDLFGTDPNSLTLRHIAYLLNTVDGRSIGFYFPNCKPIGAIPTQSEIDSLNYVPIQFAALTNTDTTNNLTLAAWVMGMG